MPLFRKRLDRRRDALELAAEFLARSRRGAGRAGQFYVLAQAFEFAAYPRCHLLAQFLAQRLQFTCDLAGGGHAVLLAAQAVEIARHRPVGLLAGGALRVGRLRVEACLPAGAIRLAAARAIQVVPIGRAAKPLLQRFQRTVQLLERGMRSALPSGVQCVEI